MDEYMEFVESFQARVDKYAAEFNKAIREIERTSGVPISKVSAPESGTVAPSPVQPRKYRPARSVFGPS